MISSSKGSSDANSTDLTIPLRSLMMLQQSFAELTKNINSTGLRIDVRHTFDAFMKENDDSYLPFRDIEGKLLALPAKYTEKDFNNVSNFPDSV